MGASASVTPLVGMDRDTFQRTAPDHYTLSLFNSIKDQSGMISPTRLLKFASDAKDCFLTHDWGKDQLGRDNHARVGKLNGLLKERGFRTWFDEEMMHGDIQQQMADGIDHAACVIVFVTERYMDKVAGKGERGELDNCLFEFSHLSTSKAKSRIFPVVMEPRCRDTASWFGKVKFVLGNQLYTDYSNDDNIEEVVDDLANKMRQVFTDGLTVSERLAFSTPLEEVVVVATKEEEQPPAPSSEASLAPSVAAANKLSSGKAAARAELAAWLVGNVPGFTDEDAEECATRSLQMGCNTIALLGEEFFILKQEGGSGADELLISLVDAAPLRRKLRQALEKSFGNNTQASTEAPSSDAQVSMVRAAEPAHPSAPERSSAAMAEPLQNPIVATAVVVEGV
eukprot:gene24391-29487_t